MKRAVSSSYRDLVVWQKAHALVLDVYRETKSFPKDELFGLTSQIRRAVVSVPANLVEGYRRRSPTEKARFLNIAESSLDETDYLLFLAHELGYVDVPMRPKIEEVSRLLRAYADRVRNSVGASEARS